MYSVQVLTEDDSDGEEQLTASVISNSVAVQTEVPSQEKKVCFTMIIISL